MPRPNDLVTMPRLNDRIRLRMKVWTDTNGMRYLVPVGMMRPGPREKIGDVSVLAYAMSDHDTKLIDLTPQEWDALPFFYFREDGECQLAERPKRSPDVIYAK